MMDRKPSRKILTNGRDVLRWVDRMLIRLCARYADYRVPYPPHETVILTGLER